MWVDLMTKLRRYSTTTDSMENAHNFRIFLLRVFAYDKLFAHHGLNRRQGPDRTDFGYILITYLL